VANGHLARYFNHKVAATAISAVARWPSPQGKEQRFVAA